GRRGATPRDHVPAAADRPRLCRLRRSRGPAAAGPGRHRRTAVAADHRAGADRRDPPRVAEHPRDAFAAAPRVRCAVSQNGAMLLRTTRLELREMTEEDL